MFGDHFADLDELLLLCRNKQARGFIAEAVTCYQVGAFRATIVSTWIAVVFDFMYKLQELALSGDKEAQKITDHLDEIHRNGNWQESIDFEKKMLDLAKNQFDLLSALEYEDLKRLFEDRNRCAHPSLLSLEEPYQPTGELARYHLRNAIVHLLQHPPVQGKAALERIWTEIRSESFPITTEEAIDRFKHGPLVRARHSLIRSVIIGLTKSLLLEERPDIERGRQLAALNAVLHMHIHVGLTILSEELPKIMQRVNDTQWVNTIKYIRHVSPAWDALGDLARKQIVTFVTVRAKEADAKVIGHAMHIPVLKACVDGCLQSLATEILAEVISLGPRSEYIDVMLQRFEKASSYNQGNYVARSLLRPLIPLLPKEHVIHAANAFLENNQLYGSTGTIDVIEEVFLYSVRYQEETREIWSRIYERIGIWGMWRYNRDGTQRDSHTLFALIEQRYPDVLKLVDDDAKQRLRGLW